MMKSRNLITIIAFGIALFLGVCFIGNIRTNENSPIIEKSQISLKEQSIAHAAEYTRTIKADPRTGKIDPVLVHEAFEHANQMGNIRGALNLTWASMGPDNVGGRTRALVVDKDDPNIIYIGGVAGGFYKSTNGGQSWIRKKYDAEAGGISISCIVQASDGTLYFGTGEAFFISPPGNTSNTGSPGGGMYKSSDRGETWEYLTSTDPTTNGSGWFNVNKLAADPNNAGKIYAATDRGLQVTENAGTDWTTHEVSPGSATSRFIDVQVSPDGQTLFAAKTGSILKSTAGSELSRVKSFSAIRITIAIAPSNPNYIYVLAISNGANNNPNSLEGLFGSTDNGETWNELVKGGSEISVFRPSPIANPNGKYHSCIAVDPTDHERVFIGGVDLFCYDHGFFYKASNWQMQYFNDYYIHADKHLIVFDTKSNPNRMWVTSDGGISVSYNFVGNKYPTYSDQNINYVTTQFYAIAASTEGDVIGGTQDNGTMRIEVDKYASTHAYEMQGGDGFHCEISTTNPNVFFMEFYYGGITRSSNRGGDRISMVEDIGFDIPESYSNWNVPFRLWDKEVDTFIIDSSGTPHDTITKYVFSKFFIAINNGGGKVYMTEDALKLTKDTISWTMISSQIGTTPLCMEYSNTGNEVFVGTAQGALYRISGIQSGNYQTKTLRTWSKAVTGLGVDPNDGNHIVVALGNYGTSKDHVYLSSNALDTVVTFKSIHGNLPAMPVYDAEIHSGNSNEIILATDLGIWATDNSNAGYVVWTEENSGMDRVPTYMIRQVKERPWHNGSMFYVGTHGMGIFSTESLVSNRGIRPDRKVAIKQSLNLYPNPCNEKLNLSFNLEASVKLQGQIYDISGRVVKNIYFRNTYRGNNLASVNTENLIPGTYFIRISGEGISRTSRFIVSR